MTDNFSTNDVQHYMCVYSLIRCVQRITVTFVCLVNPPRHTSHTMQRLNAVSGVYFDPVQRAEQWKQVVSKEEKHLGLSPRSVVERPPKPAARSKPPRLGVDGSIRHGGAGAGSGASARMSARSGLRSSRSQLRSSRSRLPSARSGMGSARSGMRSSRSRGEISARRRNDFALSTARSSLSYRSSASRASSRSSRSRSSRSRLDTARSGYSMTSSLPSSASGMTAVALQRLEKLEKVCRCRWCVCACVQLFWCWWCCAWKRSLWCSRVHVDG